MWDILQRIREQVGLSGTRTVNVVVKTDQNGVEQTIPVSGTEVTISRDGFPDTINYQFLHFWDCGHTLDFAPCGGRCYQCLKLNCVKCFSLCVACKKPICTSCVVDKQPFSICRLCFKKIRKENIKRILLSPFVKFEGEEKKKEAP